MWAKLLIAGVMAAATFAAGWRTSEHIAQQRIDRLQAAWDAERTALAQANLEQATQAQQRQATLQAALDKRNREHKRDLASLDTTYRNIVDSLRNRPAARADGAAGVPDGASAGVGCTGAGLSGPDAAFLAGLAADAARTQAALDACRAAYDDVRQAHDRAH